MGKEIEVFNHEVFGVIRAFNQEEKAWFCLSDVCHAVDLKNPRQVKARLDERGVITMDTPTQNQFGATVIQQMTYVDEPNLYRCIFQSRKKEAQQFQDWVFGQVLPSIRQHGAYMTPKTLTKLLQEPESIEVLLNQLHAEQTRRIEAEQTIEEQKDKVDFAEAVVASKGSIYIAQLANLLYQNGYVTGQNRLFQTLRDLGYLYKTTNGTRPKQCYVESGLFEVNVNVWENDNGDKYESFTTMVTPKGQKYFIDLFCKKEETQSIKKGESVNISITL